MKLAFLGTGAATGLPLPFCRCDTCEAARRLGGKDIRRRSSLAVNDDMLIDLGPDSVAACAQLGIGLPDLKYLLQTHAHSDHFDAGHLITRLPEYAGEGVSELKLVASRTTLGVINAALKRECGGAGLDDAGFRARTRLTPVSITHGETVRMGEYEATAYSSLHDESQQAMLFLIKQRGKCLLYATDICSEPYRALRAIIGERIDALVIDQTYGAGKNAGGHPDAAQVAEAVKRLRDVGALNDNSVVYATHISHEGNPTHEHARELALRGGYDIAYDGLTIEI